MMTNQATNVVLGGLSFAGGFVVGTVVRHVYIFRKRPNVVPVENQLAFDFDEEELVEAVASERSSLFNRIEAEKLRYARDHGLDVEEDTENPNYRQPRPDPSDIVVLDSGETTQLKDYLTQYDPNTGTTPSEEIQINIFKSENPEWDYEAELSTRTAETPYVISKEEYFEDEAGNEQLTFTYYEGDEVLTDDHDVPIDNFRTRFPEMPFGHGSGDTNVVYIRDEKREAEYEILRHTGLFSVEIEGMQIEQSFETVGNRVPKFRPE